MSGSVERVESGGTAGAPGGPGGAGRPLRGARGRQPAGDPPPPRRGHKPVHEIAAALPDQPPGRLLPPAAAQERRSGRRAGRGDPPDLPPRRRGDRRLQAYLVGRVGRGGPPVPRGGREHRPGAATGDRGRSARVCLRGRRAARTHASRSGPSRIGTWWPADHTVTGRGDLTVVLEERSAAGSSSGPRRGRARLGRGDVWEPPTGSATGGTCGRDARRHRGRHPFRRRGRRRPPGSRSSTAARERLGTGDEWRARNRTGLGEPAAPLRGATVKRRTDDHRDQESRGS